MYKWLRYSGVSVIITVNPLWWRVLPWARREHNEWAGPCERTWSLTWLFLTVRIWIDNGSW
jgi:hypothetical protein